MAAVERDEHVSDTAPQVEVVSARVAAADV
jgi:hypothetical protein